MEWEEYYARYKTFTLAFRQAELVALVAAKTLSDFPSNLPADWRRVLATGFRSVADQLTKAAVAAEAFGKGVAKPNEASQSPKVEFERRQNGVLEPSPHNDVLITSLMVILESGVAENKLPPQAYPEVAYSQHLVMGFAHASAFICDTVRAICRRRPDILKCDRKLEWKAIIELGSWDAVFSRLVEDYVYKFGWDPIADVVMSMQERLGLKLDIPAEELERIRGAELLRNLIVHDGGRVNGEYLKRSGRSDLTIGQRISIDPDFVKQVCEDLFMLSSDVMLEVSAVHFGKTRDEISLVWRRHADGSVAETKS